MSKQGRTLPEPAVSASPPPDLSGGGDVIMDAPPEGRSTRPGPQPKVIRESFSNPGMAQAPDVKVLNERKYDSARSKVRAQALEKMPDLAVGTRLPGPAPIDTEEGEQTTTEVPEEGETTQTEEPKLDEKTAAQLAAKDREARQLRQKIRAIEQSGASATKKEAKLKELAKTNPRGVAEYFGIDFVTYLQQVQKGESTPIKLEDDPPARAEDEETEKLRQENQRLKATENSRIVRDYLTEKVTTTKDETGRLKYPRIARVGARAVQAVAQTVQTEMNKMRKLTAAEAAKVVEHFLDEREAEYRAAGAADEAPRGKQPPNPRRPTTLPPKNPMDQMRHARDPDDPRNRPTTSDIKARVRARLIGS